MSDPIQPEAERTKTRAPFTPEATVGPFFPGLFVVDMSQDLTRKAPMLAHRPQGEPISISGRVLDELGQPVVHAILEFWQANAQGRYRHPLDHSERPLDPHFDGFARVSTDIAGEYSLVTIKPGAHPAVAGGLRAPHLRVTLFASGVDRLYTQVFFMDEPLNSSDPLLGSISDQRVRGRLIASRVGQTGKPGINSYRLDFILRGEQETPFFDDWAESNGTKEVEE